MAAKTSIRFQSLGRVYEIGFQGNSMSLQMVGGDFTMDEAGPNGEVPKFSVENIQHIDIDFPNGSHIIGSDVRKSYKGAAALLDLMKEAAQSGQPFKLTAYDESSKEISFDGIEHALEIVEGERHSSYYPLNGDQMVKNTVTGETRYSSEEAKNNKDFELIDAEFHLENERVREQEPSRQPEPAPEQTVPSQEALKRAEDLLKDMPAKYIVRAQDENGNTWTFDFNENPTVIYDKDGNVVPATDIEVQYDDYGDERVHSIPAEQSSIFTHGTYSSDLITELQDAASQNQTPTVRFGNVEIRVTRAVELNNWMVHGMHGGMIGSEAYSNINYPVHQADINIVKNDPDLSLLADQTLIKELYGWELDKNLTADSAEKEQLAAEQPAKDSLTFTTEKGFRYQITQVDDANFLVESDNPNIKPETVPISSFALDIAKKESGTMNVETSHPADLAELRSVLEQNLGECTVRCFAAGLYCGGPVVEIDPVIEQTAEQEAKPNDSVFNVPEAAEYAEALEEQGETVDSLADYWEKTQQARGWGEEKEISDALKEMKADVQQEKNLLYPVITEPAVNIGEIYDKAQTAEAQIAAEDLQVGMDAAKQDVSEICKEATDLTKQQTELVKDLQNMVDKNTEALMTNDEIRQAAKDRMHPYRTALRESITNIKENFSNASKIKQTGIESGVEYQNVLQKSVNVVKTVAMAPYNRVLAPAGNLAMQVAVSAANTAGRVLHNTAQSMNQVCTKTKNGLAKIGDACKKAAMAPVNLVVSAANEVKQTAKEVSADVRMAVIGWRADRLAEQAVELDSRTQKAQKAVAQNKGRLDAYRASKQSAKDTISAKKDEIKNYGNNLNKHGTQLVREIEALEQLAATPENLKALQEKNLELQKEVIAIDADKKTKKQDAKNIIKDERQAIQDYSKSITKISFVNSIQEKLLARLEEKSKEVNDREQGLRDKANDIFEKTYGNKDGNAAEQDNEKGDTGDYDDI
jgi:hypothetical protein